MRSRHAPSAAGLLESLEVPEFVPPRSEALSRLRTHSTHRAEHQGPLLGEALPWFPWDLPRNPESFFAASQWPVAGRRGEDTMGAAGPAAGVSGFGGAAAESDDRAADVPPASGPPTLLGCWALQTRWSQSLKRWTAPCYLDGVLAADGPFCTVPRALVGSLRSWDALGLSPQPRGLVNFGNSCYMNASLQCLLHVPAFGQLVGLYPYARARSQRDAVLRAHRVFQRYRQRERARPLDRDRRIRRALRRARAVGPVSHSLGRLARSLLWTARGSSMASSSSSGSDGDARNGAPDRGNGASGNARSVGGSPASLRRQRRQRFLRRRHSRLHQRRRQAPPSHLPQAPRPALPADEGLGCPAIEPWTLFRQVTDVLPDFDAYRQQDAHEFIAGLLDVLEAEQLALARLLLRPAGPAAPPLRALPLSAVSAVFGGQTCTQTRCSRCGAVSTVTEPMLTWSLMLSSAPSQDLLGRLAAAVEAEPLAGANQYRCSSATCRGTAQDAWQGRRVLAAPSTLILHLARFRMGAGPPSPLDPPVSLAATPSRPPASSPLPRPASPPPVPPSPASPGPSSAAPSLDLPVPIGPAGFVFQKNSARVTFPEVLDLEPFLLRAGAAPPSPAAPQPPAARSASTWLPAHAFDPAGLPVLPRTLAELDARPAAYRLPPAAGPPPATPQTLDSWFRGVAQPQRTPLPAFFYVLTGVLVHLGPSPHSGHYLCYVRSPPARRVTGASSAPGPTRALAGQGGSHLAWPAALGPWVLVDDEQVQPVPWAEVQARSRAGAYLLFYARFSATGPNPLAHHYFRTPLRILHPITYYGLTTATARDRRDQHPDSKSKRPITGPGTPGHARPLGPTRRPASRLATPPTSNGRQPTPTDDPEHTAYRQHVEAQLRPSVPRRDPYDIALDRPKAPPSRARLGALAPQARPVGSARAHRPREQFETAEQRYRRPQIP